MIRLDDVMRAALARKASDIHLSPGLAPMLRVDGRLERLESTTLIPPETEFLARRLLGDPALERLAREGDVSSTWTGYAEAVVRVHAFAALGLTHLALRILPRSVPSLEELGAPPVVETFAAKQRGLVIFTGPTGSGKSTSLAALVGKINDEHSRRIVTVEDPIEYRHSNRRSTIVQREVGRDVPSFAHAVNGALRSDPDVIVIGEMREPSTMRAAVTAAETGHLVLTTLHTGDAIQTIDRIVDAFEPGQQAQIRAQLAASLVAVVCQRLVPAVGNGRRLAAEILIATDAVRTTIRESRTHQLRNLMLTGRSAGMQTLESHLTSLLAEGAIARADAEPLAERFAELQVALRA